MSAPVLACQRSPLPPVLIVALLTATVLSCSVVAVAQVVTAPGPALLMAGVLALAGWLVKAVVAVVPLPWLVALVGLVVLVAVSPWLVLAVLACLALRHGRSR